MKKRAAFQMSRASAGCPRIRWLTASILNASAVGSPPLPKTFGRLIAPGGFQVFQLARRTFDGTRGTLGAPLGLSLQGICAYLAIAVGARRLHPIRPATRRHDDDGARAGHAPRRGGQRRRLTLR